MLLLLLLLMVMLLSSSCMSPAVPCLLLRPLPAWHAWALAARPQPLPAYRRLLHVARAGRVGPSPVAITAKGAQEGTILLCAAREMLLLLPLSVC